MRQLSRLLIRKNNEFLFPDSGRTLSLKTDEVVPVLVATATESPVNSARYNITWSEQDLYGFWYLDDVKFQSFGRIYLGSGSVVTGSLLSPVNSVSSYSSIINSSTSVQTVTGSMNVSGSLNVAGAINATSFVGNGSSLTNITGSVGPSGSTGAQGIQGIQGIQGDQGPSGTTGPAGTTDHALLTNLTYASSGHTGFAGLSIVNNFTVNQNFQAGFRSTGSILSSGSIAIGGASTGISGKTFSVSGGDVQITHVGAGITIHARCNGSLDSPTQVLAGEELSSIDFRGFNGTVYNTGASIRGLAEQTFGADNRRGTALLFYTISSGSTLASERVRITDGRVGMFTTVPTDNLHVAGTGKFEGNLQVTGSVYSSVGFVGDGSLLTNVTGSLTKDHAGLTNLAYATSGHTGFESQADFQFVSGSIATFIASKAAASGLASLDVNSKLVQTRVRADDGILFTTLANDTLAQAYATNSATKLTVTANRTLTTTVPAAGVTAYTIILTSGVSSFTITFGSGFKPTATLATGTTTARVFVISWISDGTNLYESGRTIAMAA